MPPHTSKDGLMANNARKKEKQRLKRKQKQKEIRKAKSVSPIRKIASAGGTLECWVNDDWENQGLASVLIFGQTPGGRGAMSAFLIDVWCVGVKDAYGYPNLSRVDFDDILDRANGQM